MRGKANGEDSAFICALGRTILVEASLRCEVNFNVRCRSYVDKHSSVLFAAPTDAASDSCQDFLGRTGRLEIIYFPYLDERNDYPWLRTWEVCDTKPAESREIMRPDNYPFTTNVPAFVTTMYNLVLGYPSDRGQLHAEITEFLRSCSGSCELTEIATLLNLCLTLINSKVLDTRRLTKLLMRVQQGIVSSNLRKPELNDLWGPSHCSLLYISSHTIRATTNGYTVAMKVKDVQRGIHFFTTTVKAILADMETQNVFPVNRGVEIRVTGLDKADSTGLPGAKAPFLTSTAMDDLAQRNGWDCVLWLAVQSVPTSRGLNTFYSRLEERLTQFVFFQPPHGLLRPEYSKGWAYTERGPRTNYDFLDSTRRNLPHFVDARAVFEKYDPKGIFGSAFLQELFNRHALPQHDSASGKAARRREVQVQRSQYVWEDQVDPQLPNGGAWGPPQVAGFPKEEHTGFWSVVPGVLTDSRRLPLPRRMP